MTLIESLVALLVLSIGLLGMVGLQMSAMQYEQGSWARATVAGLTADIADRIRANPASAESDYSFTRTYTAERTDIDAGAASYFTPTKDCNSTTCTPAELAKFDSAGWRSSINDQLPAATGFIVSRGTKGKDLNFLVTIAWVDKRMHSGDVNTSCESTAAAAAGIKARNCCPDQLSALPGTACVTVGVTP